LLVRLVAIPYMQMIRAQAPSPLQLAIKRNTALRESIFASAASSIAGTAVLVDRGCDGQFCLNVLLTCLGYLPGVVHAWTVLFCCPGLTNETFLVAGPPPPVPAMGAAAPMAAPTGAEGVGAVGAPVATGAGKGVVAANRNEV
jgi:uncharacterized membrane protein YqaE (UPF0057 family)